MDTYGLYFLATKAAVDIDNYRKNKTPEGKSVQQLSQALDKSAQRGNLGDIAILGNSFSRIRQFPKCICVRDTLLETRSTAKSLRDFKDLPETEQEKLANFCVKLSKELSSLVA